MNYRRREALHTRNRFVFIFKKYNNSLSKLIKKNGFFLSVDSPKPNKRKSLLFVAFTLVTHIICAPNDRKVNYLCFSSFIFLAKILFISKLLLNQFREFSVCMRQQTDFSRILFSLAFLISSSKLTF